MVRRRRRSTRTDTLFPYTTLCRSQGAADNLAALLADRLVEDWAARRRARLSAPHGGERGLDARLATEKALVRHHLTVSDAAARLRESDRHVVRRALADIVHHASRSEEHTSELQSLMRISYAVFS